MSGCKADLVAVAGIATGSLAGYHALGKLSGDGIGDLRGYIPRPRDAHGLIHVCTAGKRVADGASKAGCRAAEGFYFSGMVVRLVLEHQKPPLKLSVHVDIHIDAAGVVLLALLHVVQKALGFKPAGADSREFHKAQGLALAAKFAAHIFKQL